jgi:hypothetical protein
MDGGLIVDDTPRPEFLLSKDVRPPHRLSPTHETSPCRPLAVLP